MLGRRAGSRAVARRSGPCSQVEEAAGLVASPAARRARSRRPAARWSRRTCPTVDRQPWRHHLRRLAVGQPERRPQRLVAADDLVRRRARGPPVDTAGERERRAGCCRTGCPAPPRRGTTVVAARTTSGPRGQVPRSPAAVRRPSAASSTPRPPSEAAGCRASRRRGRPQMESAGSSLDSGRLRSFTELGASEGDAGGTVSIRRIDARRTDGDVHPLPGRAPARGPRGPDAPVGC